MADTRYFVARFARHRLLDESRVVVVSGAGAPVLLAHVDDTLELEGVTRFSGGLVELRNRVPR